MDEYNINHYSTYSNLKASIVERVIRTLKTRLWKQFSLLGTYKWIDIIDKIVYDYNNTKHSVTGFKPKEVNKKNEKEILSRVYSPIKMIDPTKPKFKVGDFVRISKYRQAFAKGYTPSWTNETFKITKVRQTNPRVYQLSELNGDEILGTFYTEELQTAKYHDMFLIEKVIKKRGNQVFVKWLGFDNKHNSWINKSELT